MAKMAAIRTTKDEAEKQQQQNASGSEDEHMEEPMSGSDNDEEGSDAENEDGGDSDGSAGGDDVDEYPADAADGDDDGEEEEEEELEAVGFGDAMSKILQQNVASDAQPILAKRTTARMREILNEKKEIKKDRVSAAEKRQKERKDNVVPTHATATKDRQHRKIATKGVVALFNAIAKHQHQAGKVADKDDKKVKELSKENFLGLLKSSVQKDKTTAAAKQPEAAKSSWSVLQDDYMMGAKLKDWDATHSNDAGRRKKATEKAGAADDDSDPEAAEDKAWKQVATIDSDDESSGKSKASGKRSSSSSASTQKGDKKKKVKRS